MSTSHHTVPATHHTTTTGAVHDKNLVHDKHAVHHNEHVKDEFNGTRGTTSSADHLRQDGLVKTGGYTTGLEAAHGTAAPAGHAVPVTAYNQGVVGGVPITNQPTAGAQFQNTVPNAANRDGLVVNDGIGGARGGAAILGGQCECTMNGGHCAHGAGNCVCRGCTTKATTINPGINIGVSTTQYTAPAGTSGIGGGVMERGTGIAGLVHANTQPTVPVDAAHQHCECVKKNGACACAPGTCACTNCSALRAAELAKAKAHQEKEKHAHGHHHDKDTHHHGHTAAAATTAAATTHAATHAHTSTHPVATTTAHSTAVPVATGATTGAHMTTHSNNIDGDGHQQTHFGQGSTVGAPVHHSATTGSTVTGAHTGQSNISHLNTASSSTKSAEHVEAGSEYASGAVHPSHVNRGAVGASIPSDPSIEHGTASSPRPITDNSDVSYLKSSQ